MLLSSRFYVSGSSFSHCSTSLFKLLPCVSSSCLFCCFLTIVFVFVCFTIINSNLHLHLSLLPIPIQKARLCFGPTPPVGVTVAVALLLYSVLDAVQPFSYAEEATFPACSTKGIVPHGPHQPKGPHKQGDSSLGCPGPTLNCMSRHALRGDGGSKVCHGIAK